MRVGLAGNDLPLFMEALRQALHDAGNADAWCERERFRAEIDRAFISYSSEYWKRDLWYALLLAGICSLIGAALSLIVPVPWTFFEEGELMIMWVLGGAVTGLAVGSVMMQFYGRMVRRAFTARADFQCRTLPARDVAAQRRARRNAIWKGAGLGAAMLTGLAILLTTIWSGPAASIRAVRDAGGMVNVFPANDDFPTGTRSVTLDKTAFARPVLPDLSGLKWLTDLHMYGGPANDADLALLLGGVDPLLDLYMVDSPMTGSGLGSLPNKAALGRLVLIRTHVDDSAVAAISQMTALTSLWIISGRLTDEDLTRLATLPALESLILADMDLTDDGVRQLARFKRLRIVRLTGTKLTDDGLDVFRSLVALERLGLSDTGITDAGLPVIATCPSLRSLDLDGTAITDAGLALLAQMPKLETLSLCATGVTDEGVMHLRGTKSLRRLDLRDTSVSPEAVIELGRALPDLHVER